MIRTIPELLEALDNLAESWKTLGHPTQAKVQADVLAELRQQLAATPEPNNDRRHRRRQ